MATMNIQYENRTGGPSAFDDSPGYENPYDTAKVLGEKGPKDKVSQG